MESARNSKSPSPQHSPEVTGEGESISPSTPRWPVLRQIDVEPGASVSEIVPPKIPIGQASLGLWINYLRKLGVSANRHDSPDLLSQLRAALVGPVDTIICSVLDTDAALPLSAALASQRASDLISALQFLSKITGAGKIILAIEVHDVPPWPDPLPKAAEGTAITIAPLVNAYPQADPTLLIYSLTGRRLTPGTLPTAAGVLLLDAVAAIAVADGQIGKPMLRTPLAIHDHVARRTHFLSVPIGMRLSNLLQSCQIVPDHKILRAGDLLRDVRIAPDAIISSSESIIHITPAELPENPDPCIRSGWCIEVCPTRVHPAKILEASQRQDSAMAERAGIHACIECGLCTHVCPSRLPLLQAIRQMRIPRASVQ